MPTESTPTATDDRNGSLDRLSLLILVGVGLLFLCKAVLAIDSAFEADEFDQFANATELLEQPGHRIQQPHRLLATVLFAAGVVVGQHDPVVGLVANRGVAVVLCVLTYLLVLRIAGRLYGTRAGVHALVGLGMVTVFVDHSYTARTDFVVLALFLLALELLLVRRTVASLLAGLVTALAFYVSFKAVLPSVALGCGLLAAAVATRDLSAGVRKIALFAGGYAIPHATYLLVRTLLADAGTSVVEQAATPVSLVVTAETGVTYAAFWIAFVRDNAVFLAVSGTGLVTAAWSWRRRGAAPDQLVVLVVVAVHLLAVVTYHQPWPYFQATAAPGLALFWGALCGSIHRRLATEAPSPLWAGAIAVLVAVGFVAPLDRVRHNLAMENDYQIAVMDRLDEVLGPEDTYFDGVGMGLTHRQTVDLWYDVINQVAYRQDPQLVQELIERLAAGHIGVLVVNERTQALPDAFQRFRDQYFVQDWGNVYVPGRAYHTAALNRGPAELPVLTQGTFHVRGETGAWRHLAIDGAPLGGPAVTLDAGDHRIEANADVGAIRVLRLKPGFVETREPLDAYKSLFPKESNLLSF